MSEAELKKPKDEAKRISFKLPEKRKLKNKAVSFLLTTENYEKLKKLSKENRRSCNDFLNCLIEQL